MTNESGSGLASFYSGHCLTRFENHAITNWSAEDSPCTGIVQQTGAQHIWADFQPLP